MGNSKTNRGVLQWIFPSCKRLFIMTIISGTVVTCWLFYVFLSEESQRSDNKNYIDRQPIHFKAKVNNNPAAPNNYKDLIQEELNVDELKDGDIGRKGLQDFEIISESVTVRRRKEKKKGHQQDTVIYTDNNPLTIPRIAEYCNIPRLPHSGQEGEVPSGYELKSVYSVIRHGDRTTLYSFPHHRNPVISCKFNSQDLSLHPKMREYVPKMQEYEGKQNIGSKFVNWALYPDHAICDNSVLSPSGALQHVMNGLHFNRKYLDKWQLFGPQFTPDQISIHVTEYSRTYQSAIALLYGFLPHFKLTELNIQQTRDIMFCSEKIVGSPCSCPAIQDFKRLANREVQSMYRNLTGLKKSLREIMEVYELEKDQLPNNYAIFDILVSYACHGIKLPCNSKGQCLTKDSLAGIADYLDRNGAAFEKSPSFQKHNQLSIYPLLMDIGQHMLSVAHQKTNEKFVLYSGHDKTVSPLLSVLGINPGKWVKYGTRVVFELYYRRDVKNHYYIRILHDGNDVTSQVTFCKGKSQNGLCKIKFLLDFLKEDALKDFGTKDYVKACQYSK